LSSNLLDHFQESSSQIFVELKVLDDFDPEELEQVRRRIFQLRKSLAEINIFGQKGDLKITS
jgi:predicted component of type VI protein secretion system